MFMPRCFMLLAVAVLGVSCIDKSKSRSDNDRSRQGVYTSQQQPQPSYTPGMPGPSQSPYQDPNTQNASCLMAAPDICEAERLIVQYINEYRAQGGAGALVQDPQIAVVARHWSQVQVEEGGGETLFGFGNYPGQIGHRGFPQERLSFFSTTFKTQPSTSFGAENVAMTSGSSAVASARSFAMQWSKSSGHRKNFMNPGFTHTGVGVFLGPKGYYATQIFSR